MAMSERITSERAAALLNAADHILILTHQYPDGDTLGSAMPSAARSPRWARPPGCSARMRSRGSTGI